MIRTNKMILLPHEIVGENEGMTKYMSDLDGEMLNIANNDSIPIDAKLLKYHQILRMHQAAKQETENPFKLEVQPATEKPSEEVASEIPQKSKSLHQTILSTVPVKFHKQAKLLFDYAHSIPGLKWSEKGEMVVDGNKVVGTNIVDLINDLSRNRTTEPPVGVDLFIKKLSDQNVPKELILNKKRLSTMTSKDIFASPLKTPGVVSHSSPISTPTPPPRSIVGQTLKNWNLLK